VTLAQDGTTARRTVKLRRTRRSATVFVVLGLVLVVVAGSGYIASQMIGVGVDHYHVANAAADLRYELGQLTEISVEFAQAAQPSNDLISQATTMERRVRSNLAVLERSGYESSEMARFAIEVRAFVTSLHQVSDLASHGHAQQGAVLADHLDTTYQGLTPTATTDMSELRTLADSTFHRVELGALGLRVLGLGAVGGGLVWAGRRRRLAATARAEQRSRARFEAMVERSWDLLVVTDVKGELLYASPALEHILGYESAASVGKQLSDVVDPDEAALVSRLCERSLAMGTAGPEDCRVRHLDGSWRTMEVIVVDLTAVPEVNGILWSVRDVTERRELERDLEQRAFTDGLTGLANRALFRDRLDHAVARDARGGRPFTVLLADLDGFKTVNDSLGHDSGDAVLVEVAARLSACRRAGDTVARLGGDEFAFLLEDLADASVAEDFASRVLDLMHQPFAVAGRELRVGLSIGIAYHREAGETAQDLLRNADVAMYSAKNQGRGRFATFQTAMHTQAQESLQLSADLDDALERHQFQVYYQPTLALASLDITGAEALLRWNHPTRGLILPGSFISMAEHSGLIVPIGRWVLEQACRQSHEWQQHFPKDPPRNMSINLSGHQLNDPQLVQDVRAILDESGVDPTTVILEITESILMEDVDATKERLCRLKDLGVRLAIDDFGTGYSSLAYLRQFPVDILKIDQSFVKAASVGASGGDALVRAIVDLGTNLNLAMVAEGIEEPFQADHMLALGCPTGQGFLFAHPMPSEELKKILATGVVPRLDTVA
jgi:diguanylate cyclase (GGDEF)-like protein/PAS domain S-box-containing protein